MSYSHDVPFRSAPSASSAWKLLARRIACLLQSAAAAPLNAKLRHDIGEDDVRPAGISDAGRRALAGEREFAMSLLRSL